MIAQLQHTANLTDLWRFKLGKRSRVIPRATHLFEEPGRLATVAQNGLPST
jgi:hypothetical protein